MRKLIFVSLLGFMPSISMSCDGCSMYEYATIKNRTYAALFYRYRVFNGYKHLNNTHKFLTNTSAKVAHQGGGPITSFAHEKDYEVYHSYEFRANYSINNKFNIMLSMPYQTAKVHYEVVTSVTSPISDTTFSVSGLGDLILIGERVFQSESDHWLHNLKFGAGVKIPTGKYKTNELESIYHPTLQPGTGSWDGMIRGTYVGLLNNTFGFNSYLSYRMNGGVEYEASGGDVVVYKFGNRLNGAASFFFLYTSIDFRLAPNFGVYYEGYGYDRRADFNEIGTGGKSLFGTGGLDITYRNLTLQLQYQRIMAENLNDEQIGNAGRFVSGLILNFE